MINRHKFSNLILSNAVCKTVLTMTDTEISDLFGRDFAAMRDFDQHNRHHCYNLLEHILRTCDGTDISGLSEGDAETLRTAAFFHDIGKPLCATPKEDRLVYHGHAHMSHILAKDILPKIGYSEAETARICFFIENHDIFMPLKLKDDVDKSHPENERISTESVLKIVSGIKRNAAENGWYMPTAHDFMILPRICIADAGAQAELTYKNGELHDTRQNKQNRAKEVGKCIEKLIEEEKI